MMKQKSRGLFALLIVGLVTLLAGCAVQERYTYVMFDGAGCAFLVERLVAQDETAVVADRYTAATRDGWVGDNRYSGTIQRLSHDDQPTCKLPKE